MGADHAAVDRDGPAVSREPDAEKPISPAPAADALPPLVVEVVTRPEEYAAYLERLRDKAVGAAVPPERELPEDHGR
jgi:hypothetical protein